MTGSLALNGEVERRVMKAIAAKDFSYVRTDSRLCGVSASAIALAALEELRSLSPSLSLQFNSIFASTLPATSSLSSKVILYPEVSLSSIASMPLFATCSNESG
jgi:hypothetical protein